MALPYSTRTEEKSFVDYDWIMVLLFRTLTKEYSSGSLPDSISFSLQDVRVAAQLALKKKKIKKKILTRNISDVKYAFDARRDFPREITQESPVTWLSTGKGKYVLRKTKRKNIIDLAHVLTSPPNVEYVIDQTPVFISKLMGTDEQAVFARVRYAGLMNQLLGFQAAPIQGHHRTSVWYGQVEIDEVLAGISGQTGVVVPVSGKGDHDRISWSQVLNLNTYGEQCLKRFGVFGPPMTSIAVRSLCLWLDKKTNEFWLVEFSPHTEIDEIEIVQAKRFKFV